MENKETLEEVAEKYYPEYPDGVVTSEMYALREGFVKGFKVCAKQQQEQDKNKYSEEEVLNLFKKYQYDLAQWVLKREKGSDYGLMPIPTEWFEEFKNTKDGI